MGPESLTMSSLPVPELISERYLDALLPVPALAFPFTLPFGLTVVPAFTPASMPLHERPRSHRRGP